jgi:hypothetical protein
MIAVDSSSWIAFFEDDGTSGDDDVAVVESALADHQVCLPPVVLCELFSASKLPNAIATLLTQIPLLDPVEGYWERAGLLRAKLLARRHRARLGDVLIAQSCIDHDVRLVTRDADFRHLARVGGLRLAL